MGYLAHFPCRSLWTVHLQERLGTVTSMTPSYYEDGREPIRCILSFDQDTAAKASPAADELVGGPYGCTHQDELVLLVTRLHDLLERGLKELIDSVHELVSPVLPPQGGLVATNCILQ